MIERQNGTDDEVVILLTTFPDRTVARQIGTQWVESQLVACVNLVPEVESIYYWKGKTETSAEVLAFAKTTRGRLEALETSLNELHPYDLPERLILTPSDGGADYLAWIRDEISSLRKETSVDKGQS